MLLWRLLRQQPLAEDHLTPLLEELAHLNLNSASPSSATLLPLLNHPNVPLRTAAVRAPSGSCGSLGLSSPDCGEFDHPDAAVRGVAVEALVAPRRLTMMTRRTSRPAPSASRGAAGGGARRQPVFTELAAVVRLAGSGCAPLILPGSKTKCRRRKCCP